MDRRRFLLTSLASTFLTPRHGRTQHLLHRIGVLSPESPPPGLVETLRDGLRELGYVEGQTPKLEFRNAEGKNGRLGR
jgi:hypothetical protein